MARTQNPIGWSFHKGLCIFWISRRSPENVDPEMDGTKLTKP